MKDVHFNRKREEENVGNFEISGYENLEKIVIRKHSLSYLNSVKICNNEKLENIEIEDGERWEENGKWYSNGAFYKVKNVIIESKK